MPVGESSAKVDTALCLVRIMCGDTGEYSKQKCLFSQHSCAIFSLIKQFNVVTLLYYVIAFWGQCILR